jgi:hypothetical protein
VKYVLGFGMQRGWSDSGGLNIYYVAKVLFSPDGTSVSRCGLGCEVGSHNCWIFSKGVTFGAVQSSETENGYKIHNFRRKEVENRIRFMSAATVAKRSSFTK